MLKRNIALVMVFVALLATWAMLGTAFAQKAPPKNADKLALGEDEVKQLLSLMDTDKNGKISREEYMKFMAAEFDRLDTDKSGELDVKELTKTQLRVVPPAHHTR